VPGPEEAAGLTDKMVMDEAAQRASLPDKQTDLEKEVEEYLRQKDRIDIEASEY
jgi:hypothetical protein